MDTIDVVRQKNPVTLTLDEHFLDRLNVRANGITNNIRCLRELTTRHDKFGSGSKETKELYIKVMKKIQTKLNDELAFIVKNYGKADSAVMVKPAKGKAKKPYVKTTMKDMLKKHG